MANVRTFNGSSDYIRLDDGTVDPTGAWTYVAVIYPTSLTGNRMIVALDDTTNQASPDVWFNLTAGALGYHLVSDYTSTSSVSANKWWLVGASRPSGTGQTIRWHMRNLTDSGSWVHENNGTASNHSSLAGGSIQLGAYSTTFDFFQGDIACVAIFESDVSDGTFEGFAGLDEVLAAGPAGMWTLDQSDVATSVTDDTGGGADQTSRSGTTVNSGVTIPNFDMNDGPTASYYPVLGVG